MLGDIELIKIIENRENSYVEFKEDTVDNKKIARELVALSNHKGGYLILGVSDQEANIVGLTRADNEERIMNICTDIVKPRINPSYYEIKIGEIKIAVIEVENGSNKPYWIEEKALIEGNRKIVKQYYNRYGSETKEIQDRDELQRLFQSSQNIHFEIIPASYSSLDNLDYEQIKTYLETKRGTALDDDNRLVLLENLEIATKVKDEYKPTIAGMLLFGKNTITRVLPQSGMMCIKVKGDDVSDEKENHKFFERNLFRNYEDSMDFFKKYNEVSISIESSKRKNVISYPERVFREIMANAIIHRDYTISGSQVSVWLFDTRVEVHSPGKLPNTITVEKMKVGIKYHRNPVLVQYFYDENIVEKMGQGIPRANRWLKENGNPELQIVESGDEVIVTIYKNTNLL